MTQDLDSLRTQIDEMDSNIINNIAQRLEAVAQIGQIKQELNLPPLDPARWQQVMSSRLELARELGVSEQLVEDIYNLIHDEALRIEGKIKHGK